MSGSRSFPGVVGHETVQAMLSRAIARGKLHHGLIVSGPRGVGKSTLARGLACALMCEVEPGWGCGDCPTCQRVLNGHHTDVTMLLGEGKNLVISAGSAREVALRSQHAPFERGGSRPAHLVIIDPADRMHPAAAAALLKSIEEPPDGVYFVLLANNEADVLATLRSRCLGLRLEGLDDGGVERVVRGEIERRGIEVADERLRLAVQLSQGSAGLALEFAGDPSLDVSTRLLASTLAAVNAGPAGIFAGDGSPLWLAWKQAVLATADPSEAIADVDDDTDTLIVVKGKKPKGRKKKTKKSASKKPAETPAKQRAAALRLAELWLIHLRELTRGRPGLDQMPQLRAADTVAISHQMTAVQRFQSGLARNPNVRLAFEDTLLRISSSASTP